MVQSPDCPRVAPRLGGAQCFSGRDLRSFAGIISASVLQQQVKRRFSRGRLVFWSDEPHLQSPDTHEAAGVARPDFAPYPVMRRSSTHISAVIWSGAVANTVHFKRGSSRGVHSCPASRGPAGMNPCPGQVVGSTSGLAWACRGVAWCAENTEFLADGFGLMPGTPPDALRVEVPSAGVPSRHRTMPSGKITSSRTRRTTAVSTACARMTPSHGRQAPRPCSPSAVSGRAASARASGSHQLAATFPVARAMT